MYFENYLYSASFSFNIFFFFLLNIFINFLTNTQFTYANKTKVEGKINK